MAISKRKAQPSSNNQWGPYLRIWRMVALLVVIGVIVFQRYQANQPRNGAQNHRDLNASSQEAHSADGEHHVDIQIIEEEPDTQAREGETAVESETENRKPEAATETPPSQSPSPKTPSESAGAGPITVIKNIQVRNLDGKVVYQGNVDVSKTLARIEAGEHLRFPNDGVVFENRERRLPIKPAGYYREWVHPTPKIDGPGPQRIVTGSEGDIYYTHDHYRTFKPLHRQ